MVLPSDWRRETKLRACAAGKGSATSRWRPSVPAMLPRGQGPLLRPIRSADGVHRHLGLPACLRVAEGLFPALVRGEPHARCPFCPRRRGRRCRNRDGDPLAERGISVDLVEVKPDVSALGSGITLQGNALRVFRELGVWPEVRRAGFGFDSLGLRAPDPAGTLVAEIPDARTGGPDLPATVGMYRPDLAQILVDRAVDAGAKIRFGTTVTAFQQDDTESTSRSRMGPASRYDLIIGADGVRSQTRQPLGIELETKSTGMGIWRVFAPRPDSVTRTDLVYGGPCYIAGYCPTGRGHSLRLPGRGRAGPKRLDARRGAGRHAGSR